jgi:hypothetical protein
MVTLEQAIKAAREEFGWRDNFAPFLILSGDKVTKRFPNDTDVTLGELLWIQEYANRNGGWDKTDGFEPFTTDLSGKTAREIMTAENDEDTGPGSVLFESFRDPENSAHEFWLLFVPPKGDDDDPDAWDACEVEVSLWERGKDNPEEAVEIAEVRLGPYHLDTPAEILAEEARANIPLVRAQLEVLPDRALSMYLALKRVTKELTNTLRWIDEEIEKHGDSAKLAKARSRAAEASRDAMIRSLESSRAQRRKEKETSH